MEDLRDLTKDMLKNNKFVIATKFLHEEAIEDPSAPFDFILRTKKPGPPKPRAMEENYPFKHFIDLWKSDAYIDELDDNHCLIYNKHMEAQRHLLVVTKE